MDVGAVVEAIASVVGDAPRPVQLHEPYFSGSEADFVRKCLDDGWVSSVGPFVDRFEQELAAQCGAEAAVAVVNGTAALQVALRLCGVEAGDEVIVPALTFVATANAVSHCGAVPHFVDSEPATLGLAAAALQRRLQEIVEQRNGLPVNRTTGRVIRAAIPVHVFGHPADMDAINRVCGHFQIAVVEDSTESLGSLYGGRPCGGLARAGVLSFNGNKIITAGGGGAILTNDGDLATRAKHLTTTAKLPHDWDYRHDAVGWNFRLPNINAALGLAQLQQLDGFVAAKRRLAQRYADAFENLPGVRFVTEPKGARSNYWLSAILLDADDLARRDAILGATHAAGFRTRPAWVPLHQLDMYRDCPRGDLRVAEALQRRLVCLPSSAFLGGA